MYQEGSSSSHVVGNPTRCRQNLNHPAEDLPLEDPRGLIPAQSQAFSLRIAYEGNMIPVHLRGRASIFVRFKHLCTLMK